MDLKAFLPIGILSKCFSMFIYFHADTAIAQDENVYPSVVTKFNVQDSLTHGIPIRLQENIFLNNPHCPSAKLDLWFSQGSVSSMLFIPGVSNDPIQRASQASKDSVDTYLIGPRECMFKVTIEPVRIKESGK